MDYPWKIYRSATHPIHFAADSPDKIFRLSCRVVFFFTGVVPWKFHKPTGRDTDFSSTPLHKQGQELRSEQTVTLYMSSTTSTCFCALKIRKQLPRNGFERSGRGQEPSRGHKFSILENVLSIRDFTSTMRLHFRSDLVGACLPQTLLMVRTWRCEQQRRVVLYITSPRSYRTGRRYNDQNECSIDP